MHAPAGFRQGFRAWCSLELVPHFVHHVRRGAPNPPDRAPADLRYLYEPGTRGAYKAVRGLAGRLLLRLRRRPAGARGSLRRALSRRTFPARCVLPGRLFRGGLSGRRLLLGERLPGSRFLRSGRFLRGGLLPGGHGRLGDRGVDAGSGTATSSRSALEARNFPLGRNGRCPICGGGHRSMSTVQ
jgi:hypothetical protein